MSDYNNGAQFAAEQLEPVILSLQKERDELREQVDVLRAQMDNSDINLEIDRRRSTEMIDQLRDQLAKVTAERDKAISDNRDLCRFGKELQAKYEAELSELRKDKARKEFLQQEKYMGILGRPILDAEIDQAIESAKGAE